MTDFPFHKQECRDYCGAACLMMLLESKGTDPATMSQYGLMKEVRKADNSVGLFCPPESIVAVANACLNPAAGCKYQVVSDQPGLEQPDISIVQADCFPEIVEESWRNLNAPVFLLAWGGAHWMLVFGTIAGGFSKRAPYWLGFRGREEGAEEKDRMHGSSPCEMCGKGGLEEAIFEAALRTLDPVAPQYSTYAGQRILVIPVSPDGATLPPVPVNATPAPVEGVQTPAELQAPEDEAPAPVDETPTPAPAEVEARKARQAPPQDPDIPMINSQPQQVRMAPPVESVQELPEEFLSTLAKRLPDFQNLFRTHGSRLRDAQLGLGVKVEHLSGDPKRAYLLVPVFCGGQGPYFLLQLTADTRELLAMNGITSESPGNEPWFQTPLRRAELEAILCEKTNQIPDGWESNRRLVWQYCDQSMSPMTPFHEIKRGDGQTAYLDVFGNLHEKLDLPHPKATPPNPRQNTPHRDESLRDDPREDDTRQTK